MPFTGVIILLKMKGILSFPYPAYDEQDQCNNSHDNDHGRPHTRFKNTAHNFAAGKHGHKKQEQ